MTIEVKIPAAKTSTEGPYEMMSFLPGVSKQLIIGTYAAPVAEFFWSDTAARCFLRVIFLTPLSLNDAGLRCMHG